MKGTRARGKVLHFSQTHFHNHEAIQRALVYSWGMCHRRVPPLNAVTLVLHGALWDHLSCVLENHCTVRWSKEGEETGKGWQTPSTPISCGCLPLEKFYWAQATLQAGFSILEHRIVDVGREWTLGRWRWEANRKASPDAFSVVYSHKQDPSIFTYSKS